MEPLVVDTEGANACHWNLATVEVHQMYIKWLKVSACLLWTDATVGVL